MAELIEKLEYAKNAVRATLESESCLVDFHGLAYWAGEVERLRKEIKALLQEVRHEIRKADVQRHQQGR